MGYKDKQRQKEYGQEHYKRNKEKYAARVLRARRDNAEVILAAKTAGCFFCGELEQVCLDFHHLDPSQKDMEVSAMTACSCERVLTEIAKCAVVCSNCHRKLHAGLLSF